MKSAAVIGATSMLGSEIVTQLRARGICVTTIGRDASNDVILDLCRPEFVWMTQKKAHADALFHCAASFSGDDAGGTRINFTVNSLGALIASELASELGVGTCVYAGTLSSAREFDPAGISSYGLSKAHAEQILAWNNSRRCATFCSLRLTQIYDTEGRCHVHQPWFGRIVAYASRGLDLALPASHGTRNFLHVEDAARLMIAAADARLQGVFPVCHPEATEIIQLARTAYAIFDRGGEARIEPGKTPFRRLDFPIDSTIFDSLGDSPRITLHEGLERIVRAGTADRFGPLDVS